MKLVRDLVRGGTVGRVAFCRASRTTAEWPPILLDDGLAVCESIDRDELVRCGTHATLVVDSLGCRRFA